MANDIIIIDSSKDINDNNIVCSTQTNGVSAKRLIYDNYPSDLTINNIENKYTDRFDEIRYYTVSGSVAPPEPSPTPTPTSTPSPEGQYPGESPTPTPTPTETLTPTPTLTRTATPTPTSTTNNISSTTPTPTVTSTPTLTVTKTPTTTPTTTPTVTLTNTPTTTATTTPTPTPSYNIVYPLSNTANFNNCADWNTLNGNVTTIGTNGISSEYDAYDFNGNVWEWNEGIIGSTYRVVRGASYASTASSLSLATRGQQNPSYVSATVGFRVATINNINNINIFVDIGDENNTSHANGYGSVSYAYKISKFLISNAQYAEFLNAVAATDTNNLYPSAMVTDVRSGIDRSGSDGSYSYSVKANMANKPVNLISWYNAARYANWLHNNKPSGSQSNATTESGAYELTGNTGMPTRNFGAQYFLPTENEWFKAAHYKSSGNNSGYWTYATRSDTVPTCVTATSTGDGITS